MSRRASDLSPARPAVLVTSAHSRRSARGLPQAHAALRDLGVELSRSDRGQHGGGRGEQSAPVAVQQGKQLPIGRGGPRLRRIADDPAEQGEQQEGHGQEREPPPGPATRAQR